MTWQFCSFRWKCSTTWENELSRWRDRSLLGSRRISVVLRRLRFFLFLHRFIWLLSKVLMFVNGILIDVILSFLSFSFFTFLRVLMMRERWPKVKAEHVSRRRFFSSSPPPPPSSSSYFRCWFIVDKKEKKKKKKRKKPFSREERNSVRSICERSSTKKREEKRMREWEKHAPLIWQSPRSNSSRSSIGSGNDLFGNIPSARIESNDERTVRFVLVLVFTGTRSIDFHRFTNPR